MFLGETFSWGLFGVQYYDLGRELKGTLRCSQGLHLTLVREHFWESSGDYLWYQGLNPDQLHIATALYELPL